ncbi:MAG: carbohydrate kinase family protein [Planctomycetota bacterium]|jgi:fructokinase
MAKRAVIGLGEVLWDLLPSGKALGGSPANVAYHANSLGAEGVVVSAVGEDDLGREILDRLGAMSLDTRHVQVVASQPTGTVSVTLDEKGTPTYVIHEDVAWDRIAVDEATLELARRADAVCFGSLAQRSARTRESVRAVLKATRDGALRVFDINLRGDFYDAELIEQSLGLANVLKISDEELETVTSLLGLDGDDDARLAELAGRYDLRLVALTQGERGSVMYEDGAFSRRDGIAVEVEDTVGAGDAFTAAVAVGMLRGMELDRINELANRVAAHVCSRKGAMPDLPEELVRAFAAT